MGWSPYRYRRNRSRRRPVDRVERWSMQHGVRSNLQAESGVETAHADWTPETVGALIGRTGRVLSAIIARWTRSGLRSPSPSRVTRRRSATGTPRTTRIGFPGREPDARRPRAISSSSVLRPRCQSTSRLASVLETQSVAARGCARRRRTPPAGGPSPHCRAVKEQPMMLQGTPPGFDHGVRELQFREGQQTAEDSRLNQRVDLGVDVSTPPSASTTGTLVERVAVRVASSRTVTLFTGANVSATRHARIRREKLSIRACRYARMPSSKRMRVVSMCHISSGPVVRRANLRLRGMHPELRAPQPNWRTRRYQVDGDAASVPSRCARMASVPVGTWR